MSMADQADEKVTVGQVIQVSRKVGDVWEWVAKLLDEEMFDVERLDDIKYHEDEKTKQAHRMLCIWSEAHGDKATLIKAMCSSERRQQAQDVFGVDLVRFVMNEY